MSADSRFHRLQALFDEAIDLTPQEREAFVERTCVDDDALRDELRRLLARELDQRVIDEVRARDALDRTLRDVLPEAFVEGRQFGPFRIVEQLGGGGMGRVFRAIRTDGAVEQEVAVKLVRADLVNPAIFQRFSTERRLLAALDHPNICRFIDAGELPDGTPYAVMEFVRGRPLFEYCDTQRLTIEQRVALLRKIAAAVSHAHRNLVIHRDIKSENILVTDDGEPKLLDFGIAKALGADGGQTQTADRFLTPANAAPEQLRGEPCGVGCDVYALGLLAYQLLSGRRAFDIDGLTVGEIERQILGIPPLPMSQRVRGAPVDVALVRNFTKIDSLSGRLSGDLDAIVGLCVRKAASERYQSAQQLDDDLNRTLMAQPVAARGSDRSYRLRKFLARHRAIVSLAVLLTATLVTAGVLLGIQAYRLSEQRDIAIVERDRAQHVVGLLQDVFISADPARIAGPDLTARQILAEASQKIRLLRDTQPMTYSSLSASVSEVNLGLAMHEDALRLAREALESPNIDEAVRRRLLIVQARANLSLARWPEVERALQRLAKIDGDVSRIDALIIRGSLLLQLRKPDEALPLFEAAVRNSRNAVPADEMATTARWELSRVMSSLDRHDEAIANLLKTIAWQKQGLSSGHPRISLSRLRLVDILRAAGRFDEALDEARETAEAVRATYGTISAMNVRAMLALATAAAQAGKYDEALDVYAECIEIGSDVLGMKHPVVATAIFNWAASTEQAGDRSAAIARFEKALEASELAYGPEANRPFYARLQVARLEAHQEDWPRVLALLTNPVVEASLAASDRENREHYAELIRAPELSRICPEANVRQCDRRERLVEMTRMHLPE